MTRYPEEFKTSVVQKRIPPNNVPVPGDGRNSEKWRSENNFSAVLQTAAMNETELYKYCR